MVKETKVRKPLLSTNEARGSYSVILILRHISVEKNRVLFVKLFPEISNLTRDNPSIASFVIQLVSSVGERRAFTHPGIPRSSSSGISKGALAGIEEEKTFEESKPITYSTFSQVNLSDLQPATTVFVPAVERFSISVVRPLNHSDEIVAANFSDATTDSLSNSKE